MVPVLMMPLWMKLMNKTLLLQTVEHASYSTGVFHHTPTRYTQSNTSDVPRQTPWKYVT
jgi:hypothetical protein